MKDSLTVFLCGTYADLSDERDAILDAVRRLQLQHDSMEFFGASTALPIDTCLAAVGRSDVLVVVVGHRYGNLVPELNISYSEAEYKEGQRLGKPCLVYFRDEDAPILLKKIDLDAEKRELLNNWKGLLSTRHTVAKFRDPQHLAVQVAADLSRTVQALQEAAAVREGAATRPPAAEMDEVRGLITGAVEKGIPYHQVFSSIRTAVSDLLATAGKRKPLVVLSHAERDQLFVEEVGERLRQRGIDVWLDTVRVSGSDTLVTRTERGLDSADFVVFFLSAPFLDSTVARRELNAAMSRQLSGLRGAVVLPVLLEEVAIPALLRDVFSLEMKKRDVEAAVGQLVELIRRHESDRLRVADWGFYADRGVDIPSDISTWDDARLFSYIGSVLEPEALARAARDYEYVTVRDPVAAVRAAAAEKLEQVARRHGFLSGWQRYMMK